MPGLPAFEEQGFLVRETTPVRSDFLVGLRGYAGVHGPGPLVVIHGQPVHGPVFPLETSAIRYGGGVQVPDGDVGLPEVRVQLNGLPEKRPRLGNAAFLLPGDPQVEQNVSPDRRVLVVAKHGERFFVIGRGLRGVAVLQMQFAKAAVRQGRGVHFEQAVAEFRALVAVAQLKVNVEQFCRHLDVLRVCFEPRLEEFKALFRGAEQRVAYFREVCGDVRVVGIACFRLVGQVYGALLVAVAGGVVDDDPHIVRVDVAPDHGVDLVVDRREGRRVAAQRLLVLLKEAALAEHPLGFVELDGASLHPFDGSIKPDVGRIEVGLLALFGRRLLGQRGVELHRTFEIPVVVPGIVRGILQDPVEVGQRAQIISVFEILVVEAVVHAFVLGAHGVRLVGLGKDRLRRSDGPCSRNQ